MDIKARRGQAFMELAVGMLALSLVLAALFGFFEIILSSLSLGEESRLESGKSALNGLGDGYSTSQKSDKVSVESFAGEYIFGKTEIPIKEKTALPNMTLSN